MALLNIDILKQADLRTDPFEYTVVPHFLSAGTLRDIAHNAFYLFLCARRRLRLLLSWPTQVIAKGESARPWAWA